MNSSKTCLVGQHNVRRLAGPISLRRFAYSGFSQPASHCRNSSCGSPYKRWPKPELQEPNFQARDSSGVVAATDMVRHSSWREPGQNALMVTQREVLFGRTVDRLCSPTKSGTMRTVVARWSSTILLSRHSIDQSCVHVSITWSFSFNISPRRDP